MPLLLLVLFLVWKNQSLFLLRPQTTLSNTSCWSFLDKAPWNRAGAEQVLSTHLPSEQTGNRPHPWPPRTDSASGLMCGDWLPPEWLHPGLDSSPRPSPQGLRARVWTAAPLLQPPATPPYSLSFPHCSMSSPNVCSSPLDSSWTPSSVQPHPSLQAHLTG